MVQPTQGVRSDRGARCNTTLYKACLERRRCTSQSSIRMTAISRGMCGPRPG
ncbi:hypothetical protein C8Q74DRAFT_1271456 [Fomes fomentarius]|nr:hypothetical protein C8Q74DRAFT_1271456 [Fomes fomentarius]